MLDMRSIGLSGVLLALLMTGCKKKDEPLMTHGKPVAYWLDELKKPEVGARKKAVTALGHVGKADAEAISALIRALKDRNAVVRNEAVLALLNIGPDAKDAIPALTEAQSDKDAVVRGHATQALERIQALH